jgi:hypothetical protein
MLSRDIDPSDEWICPRWEDRECECESEDRCDILLDAEERRVDERIYEIERGER